MNDQEHEDFGFAFCNDKLSHALMRASIAEGNVKALEAENARLRADLDRVVAML